MLKVIVLTFIFSLSLRAESTVWRVNKDHSELFFKVPYLTLSHVTGRFTKYNGRISFTDEQSFPSNIRLKIDSSSVFTGSKIRDGHLRAKDFFNVKSYSSITFISDNVIAKGPGKFEVWGLLSITNIKKRVKVLIEITESTKDSWKFENKFISFKTFIDRTEFGLTWNKSLQNNQYLVGNNIEIWGNFQVQP